MTKHFMLPMERFKVIDSYTDCRMYCFSRLASYYNYTFSVSDLIGYSACIEFELINVSNKKIPIYAPQGKNLNGEVDFLTNQGFNIKCEQLHLELSPKDVLDKLSEKLICGIPLILNVDRFYLNYLKVDPAHMGWHTVIVVGFSLEKEEIYVVDCLSDHLFNTMPIEEIHAAIYSDIPLSTERKMYYIHSIEDTVGIVLNNFGTFVKTLERLFSKALGDEGYLSKSCAFLDYMVISIEKAKKNDDIRFKKYIQMQLRAFIDSLIQQDFYKSFFRKAYFSFVLEQLSKYSSELIKAQFLTLFNELSSLWDKIAYADNDEDKLKEVIEAFRLEKEILLFLQKEFVVKL